MIHSAVSSSAGLSEGQDAQSTNESCTELKYNVVTPFDSEQMLLYAEGPCKDTGISRAFFFVSFENCPIGFKDSPSACVCDPDIFPDYVTDCSIDNETVLRKDNVWISYINSTDQEGFLKYSNCPHDYCYPRTEQVWINFNIPIGADAQCAYNRSGKLCGSSDKGLSLSLGSSQCKKCSNNWLVLLIPFVVAGVALVAMLLVCNMTVDKGTLNGVIYYANVIGTNRTIFFPFKAPNILSIFIAWVNLDFGFETCFFDGMDGYVKTWLQLALPLYIIFLVAAVIIGCEHSHYLTRFLRRMKWNPVTTLSTLILLSYTKLVRTIIAALSFARLEYPDGSYEMVWLFDANIPYLGWKHALLFITAIVVLLFGLLYTLLLFLWQWLQYCPNKKSLKWIRNTKLFAFMDAYHDPYDPKHRYWTGLLLLARVVLYLVSSFNVNHDPSINLLSIICVVTFLLILTSHPTRRIYKKWPLNVLEHSFLFNLIVYSSVTLFTIMNKGDQNVIAYVSIGIAFCTFLGILTYHSYMFVLWKNLHRMKLPCFKRKIDTQPLLEAMTTEAHPEEPTYSEFILPDHEPLDTDEGNEIETKTKEQDIIQRSGPDSQLETALSYNHSSVSIDQQTVQVIGSNCPNAQLQLPSIGTETHREVPFVEVNSTELVADHHNVISAPQTSNEQTFETENEHAHRQSHHNTATCSSGSITAGTTLPPQTAILIPIECHGATSEVQHDCVHAQVVEMKTFSVSTSATDNN